MGLPRFFAPDAEPGRALVDLPDDEAHHLRHVLRLAVGDQVIAFDGAGHEWSARVSDAGRSGVQLVLEAETTPVAEPLVRITLGIGLLKGDQMDTVVRDATALGVAEIVPLLSDHVVVPTRAVRIDRWKRVAVSSAKQCHRAVVPKVHPMEPLDRLIERSSLAARLICVEPAAGPPLPAFQTAAAPSSALLLVGPEGGWASAEVDLALRAGCTPVGLGPRTLRAETVPTVALAALWTVWGW
jgi:16S rRNA (uracil1498-N3)-methyltransferase